MKPKLLSAPPLLFAPSVTWAIEEAQFNSLGEVDSRSISVDQWNLAPFFDHLRSEHGYRPRECVAYPSLTLTYVKGACPWHVDPGFGLVACWLVYDDNEIGYEPQLITKHGPLEMRTGDLCVFDANQGHAWLGNGTSVMVMATIAPTAKRHGI